MGFFPSIRGEKGRIVVALVVGFLVIMGEDGQVVKYQHQESR